MIKIRARKILLPTFTFTATCSQNDVEANRRELHTPKNKREIYYFSLNQKNPRQYNLLPVVIDAAGIPWPEANIYVLTKLLGTLSPAISTYHSIADDLAAFLQFLENENISFTEFPNNKLYRSTYRYRAFLIRSVHAGELAISTARRRLASVVGFYRWLIDENMLQPDSAPWRESEGNLRIKDNHGFIRIKKIKTTDLSIKISQQIDPYDGTIGDGGKLRPLLPDEQSWLVKALISLRNTEMTLIHLVALATGARIQTILTFRFKHVKLENLSFSSEIAILTGFGTEIDTKGGKRYSVFLPTWLYEKLFIYAHSERARRRRLRARGGDIDEQYLFLSVRGAPLYESKADASVFNAGNNLRHAKKGQGVRQYIKQYVIPFIQNNFHKDNFRYRFHDLRATFGMNLTDHQLSLVESKRTTLHQAREFVKHRMGHTSAATTDLYLCYRENARIVTWAQDEYEMRLQNLANWGEANDNSEIPGP